MFLFGDILLFALSLLVTTGLIFLLIYFLITLSDLECDYLNANECCDRLNFWNVPKLWLQLSLTALLLLSGHWVLVLLHTPIVVFLCKRYFRFPRTHISEYDPAEIHNFGELKKHLIAVCAHLVWQMVGFFVFLFSLLEAVMQEPINLEQDDVEVLNRPAAEELYQPKVADVGSDL